MVNKYFFMMYYLFIEYKKTFSWCLGNIKLLKLRFNVLMLITIAVVIIEIPILNNQYCD